MKPKVVGSLPEPIGTHYDHKALSAMMREHPGEWIRIDRGAVNRMQALAAKWRGERRPAGFGSGDFGFRAISAGRGSGEAKLYGRFIPASE